jgi:hypothetical protein
MAKKLSKILGERLSPFVVETGLEQGQVEVFIAGPMESVFGTNDTDRMCWKSPGTGTLQIEIWGAGGSSGKNCCCGAGVPGNPGAYSKKTICVDSATMVCGFIGNSCNNNSLCYKGCSQATCITICSPNGLLSGGCGNTFCICMCAEGGTGGSTYCNGSCPPYWCLIQNGFPGTNCANCDMSDGCGIVCNLLFHNPRYAYGGDVNCNSGDPDDVTGNWSCSTFHACYPCMCGHHDHVAIPPGIIAEEGAVVTTNLGCASNFSATTGAPGPQLLNMITGAGRKGGPGSAPNASCWSGNRACNCYETSQCVNWIPAGIPGPTGHAVGDIRDHGWRGGPGMVRLKFIGS